MKHDELMHFFDVLTTLRDEYAKSADALKVEKIATLAQIAVEIIKQGQIPDSLQLERNSFSDPTIMVTTVKELFSRLSIDVEHCYMVFDTSDKK